MDPDYRSTYPEVFDARDKELSRSSDTRRPEGRSTRSFTGSVYRSPGLTTGTNNKSIVSGHDG